MITHLCGGTSGPNRGEFGRETERERHTEDREVGTRDKRRRKKIPPLMCTHTHAQLLALTRAHTWVF